MISKKNLLLIYQLLVPKTADKTTKDLYARSSDPLPTTNRSGRLPLDPETKELIIRMKKENRLWGQKRIHGELSKIGVDISETMVRTILRRANIRPWDGQSSENWRSFFKRHKNIWAIDFFTVHSAPFKRMFVLVIMDIHSRRLISTRVTTNPTPESFMTVIPPLNQHSFEICAHSIKSKA